jgi:hypothetical protein
VPMARRLRLLQKLASMLSFLSNHQVDRQIPFRCDRRDSLLVDNSRIAWKPKHCTDFQFNRNDLLTETCKETESMALFQNYPSNESQVISESDLSHAFTPVSTPDLYGIDIFRFRTCA